MTASRPATVADVQRDRCVPARAWLVRGIGRVDNPIYSVRGKSFVYFRNPRPDAVDPESGERYTDMIVLWVDSQADKRALVEDEGTPFFTTSHFDGYLAVLVRVGRLDELGVNALAEVTAESWLVRAPKRVGETWLAEHPTWPAER